MRAKFNSDYEIHSLEEEDKRFKSVSQVFLEEVRMNLGLQQLGHSRW